MFRKKHFDKKLTRRQIFNGSLSAAAGISLRSVATGLPASFLLTGTMPAQAQTSSKGLILSFSDDGESFNCIGPGMYSSDSNDPRYGIERLAVHSTPVDISLGDVQTQAASPFGNLPQGLLDRTCIFNLRTNVNGHPEGPDVRGMNGVLKDPDGRFAEEIQSAIMQELVSSNLNQGSTLLKPFVMRTGGKLGRIAYEGQALTKYEPFDIRNLYLGGSASYDLDDMKRLYDSAIDTIYKDIKSNGTPAQKRYLDEHAATRAQAATLGDSLGQLLTDVTGNTFLDQFRVAVAMMKVNLTPVVTVQYAYSLDNHGDVEIELDRTEESVENLSVLWQLLNEHSLTETVTYATWDVFGRTTRINGQGGRDHLNSHCLNMIMGAGVKPGIVGGQEHHTRSGKPEIRASGINSITGLSTNPDITTDETLSAYGRTLMASLGISEERIDVRIPHSKTVSGALA